MTDQDPVTAAIKAACRKTDSDIPEAIERVRSASAGMVEGALALARRARKSQSHPKLVAVRLDQPLPRGDLTGRFEAYKPR